MTSMNLIEQIFSVVALLEKTGNRIFREARLTTNLAAVLLCIQSGRGKNSELCAFLHGSPSAIAQKLTLLEKKMLIRRGIDATDKRSWQFTLTPQGQQALAACMPKYQRAADALFLGVTLKEQTQLFDILVSMREKLLLGYRHPTLLKNLF